MRSLDTDAATTYLGLAYGPSALAFIDAHPGLIDYVELPFEQLRHAPEVAAMGECLPLVLHCASLSIAGFVPPSTDTIAAIRREVQATRTPWLGEHLAFMSADGLNEDAEAVAAPAALSYTVCPQLSEETVERVLENLATLRPQLSVPLILENSPQYFAIPGSTLGMVDFIAAVCARADVGLLLDLSHFLITALNTNIDASTEIERLPLERVVEIHLSGLSRQSGIVWDDHAVPAPPALFALLEQVLRRVRPRALTLEYNWSPNFPQSLLRAQVARLRERLACA
jgi:uncharacterized protein (UPF0276 family)